MIEVEVKNINKHFGNFRASDNVSFAIERGKLIGLLGPSGSGKTTILRMIAGLETPDSGEIFIGGRKVNDLPPGERGIGFLFQSYALFKHMTVFDNIAFGLTVQKKSDSEIKSRVEELARLIGLKDFTSRYPLQLSGGQRQRVAFARAMVTSPKILLADEPTGALDTKTGAQVMEMFRKINLEQGTTIIIVTHDPGIGASTKRCIRILDGQIVEEAATTGAGAVPTSQGGK